MSPQEVCNEPNRQLPRIQKNNPTLIDTLKLKVACLIDDP